MCPDPEPSKPKPWALHSGPLGSMALYSFELNSWNLGKGGVAGVSKAQSSLLPFTQTDVSFLNHKD